MTYRHATNMRVPLDAADLNLLSKLSDYRIGKPVQARHRTGYTERELLGMGYVGLYLNATVFEEPDFRKLTGWGHADAILGVEWES